MGRKNLRSTRRLEIIEAFYKISKQTGLENASIAKVAEEMGISSGLVMHYFNTREELLLGLNEYILQQHLKVLFAGDKKIIKNRQDLENLVENLFSRTWNQYFDDGVFYSCYALIYRNKAVNNSFKQYLLELHTVLHEELEQAYQNEVIFNTNLGELTEIIFALVDGAYYFMGMFDRNDPSHQKQQQLYISHCLSLFKYSK